MFTDVSRASWASDKVFPRNSNSRVFQSIALSSPVSVGLAFFRIALNDGGGGPVPVINVGKAFIYMVRY